MKERGRKKEITLDHHQSGQDTPGDSTEFLEDPVCLKCKGSYDKSQKKCPHCGELNPIRSSWWRSRSIASPVPIIFLAFALLLTLTLFLALLISHKSFIDSLSIVTGATTVTAIIVGGYWAYMLFVRKRQKYPRAKVEHMLRHWELPDGNYLLHLVLKVSNGGEVLLTLAELDIWIGKVIPWPPKDSLKEALCQAIITNISETGTIEVEWPRLHGKTVYLNPKRNIIEPGEEDEMHFDFSIPHDVEMVHVYTHLRNVSRPAKDIGWFKSSFYEIGTPDEQGV